MPTGTLDAFVLDPAQWLLLGVAGERHHDTISDLPAALVSTRASWPQVRDLESRGLVMPVELDELPLFPPTGRDFSLMLTSAGKRLYTDRIRPYRACLQLAAKTSRGVTVKSAMQWCGVPRLAELERAQLIQVSLGGRPAELEDVLARHTSIARITLRPRGRHYLADTKG